MLVAKSHLTLCNPMDYLPGFSVHEILQAIILEWLAFLFSRGSSWPRVSYFTGRFFTIRGTREALDKSSYVLNTSVSVQFSRSVMFDSLWPHESQHARPPCPSPTPGVYPNSRPLSRWCHPAISSSVVPFSSCPQSLPASGSFAMSQLFAWGGQVLEFQLQHQSFQWTPRTDLL